MTGHDFWRALAFTGFFLNLFNLLPVVPLDGGRAMAAMAPWMWGLGFLGIVALAILFPNPIILIIAVFAGYETYKRWKLRRSGSLDQLIYYRVRPRDRWLVAVVYLSLVALLVIGMDATHLPAHARLGSAAVVARIAPVAPRVLVRPHLAGSRTRPPEGVEHRQDKPDDPDDE